MFDHVLWSPPPPTPDFFPRAFVFFSSPVPKEFVNHIKSDTSVLPRIGALREVQIFFYISVSSLVYRSWNVVVMCCNFVFINNIINSVIEKKKRKGRLQFLLLLKCIQISN